MIYGLFIWTVIAASSAEGRIHDWRLAAELRPFKVSENTEASMLKKCRKTAEELNLSKERYRCVRLS